MRVVYGSAVVYTNAIDVIGSVLNLLDSVHVNRPRILSCKSRIVANMTTMKHDRFMESSNGGRKIVCFLCSFLELSSHKFISNNG